jgi:hypothetical protein
MLGSQPLLAPRTSLPQAQAPLGAFGELLSMHPLLSTHPLALTASRPSAPQARKDVATQGTFLRVVQLSLLGSIVSNLLLVMGTAFVAGGVKRKVRGCVWHGACARSAARVLLCVGGRARRDRACARREERKKRKGYARCQACVQGTGLLHVGGGLPI